ncbi:hypothetical protein [Corynebacterium anserum]|uniref:Uncharacterized protein n=1 Tax=Corynebacterium anserum TaxID=2684406 RepID=A0A7G7YN78_9CORY|nr:hypothetical protein [Corynebacterium anserum]MBC2681490.1 hypothetical protein [Corynebacterium anserum]QNH95948.1 hypothetical protein GP473_03985 [Corynebacterium anserum]
MGRFIRQTSTTLNVVIATAMVGGLVAGCGVGETNMPAKSEGEVIHTEGGTKSAAPVVTKDGRMLKPEGYEGIWFETEPTDPWERLVWLSQEFVGDPVFLGQLGPNDAADAFTGQPDICSDELVARMESMGLENRKGVNAPRLYSCDFELKLKENDFFNAFFSIEMIRISGRPNFDSIDYNFGPKTSNIVRRVPGAKVDLHCVAVEEIEASDSIILISSLLPGESKGFKEACRRSYNLYWTFKNLGILEGAK